MADERDDDNEKKRGPGRPRGRTAQGERTRSQLYEAAIARIAERGYEATTMRDVARAAGVSAGLLYRYFPGKQAIVLELYESLSRELADATLELEPGRWRARFLDVLELSLDVLGPHREALVALVPVLVSTADDGLFGASTTPARERVMGAFVAAVVGADDAPASPAAEALGRLLYLVHLAVILWWLLDRSPAQRATRGFVSLLEGVLPMASVGLRMPAVRRQVLRLDELVRAAFLDAPRG